MQINVGSTCTINNTVQFRFFSYKSKVNSTSIQCKDITIQYNIITSTFCTHVHIDSTVVSSQCVVTVVSAFGNSNLTTLSNGNTAIFCINGNTITINVHIYTTADIYLAFIYRGKDTCVIETAEYIVSISFDAPGLIICAFNAYIAINGDNCRIFCGITCFTTCIVTRCPRHRIIKFINCF